MVYSFSSLSHPLAQAAHQALLFLKTLAAVLFFCFLLLYLHDFEGAQILKALQCAAVFALAFLPRALHLEQSVAALCFAAFLFFAAILGSVFSLFETLRYYDVLIHLLSGVVCVAALRDFLAVKKIALSGGAFVLLALLLTAATAGLWEMYEFVAFHMLKNTAFSLRALLGELGFATAREAASAAIKENVSLYFGTAEGILQNAYDTFCDMLCALAAALLCALGFCANYAVRKKSGTRCRQ